MELTWLHSIMDVLPDDANYQKSFFDISGFPRWETVNSNLLAFYFNRDEEHNFETLFIESLLCLLQNENDINFYDNYDVFREYRTNKGNFIDIVIKSNPEESLDSEPESEEIQENQNTDWAIIIENKIDAGLYNNLSDYWASVEATNKIGVVLSKNEIDLAKYNNKGTKYYSITHKALIEQVQQNLSNYFSKANEKHLLFLKEYINNIDNLYLDSIMDENNTKILTKLYEHKTEIAELHKQEKRLLQFIFEEVFSIFTEYGFKPYSNKNTSMSKHFYADTTVKEKYQGFRFFVNIGHMLYNKEFNACFELHGKASTKYGTKLKGYLSNNNVFTNYVVKGSGGGDKGGYNHIYVIRIPLVINEQTDFVTELHKQLKAHFFDHNNGFLDKAIEGLKQIKAEYI